MIMNQYAKFGHNTGILRQSFSSPSKPPKVRSVEERRPTCAAQRRENEYLAREHMELIISNNFKPGQAVLASFTFNGDGYPQEIDEIIHRLCKKDDNADNKADAAVLKDFADRQFAGLRARLQTRYDRYGLKLLYISVFEYTSGRLHFHIVLNVPEDCSDPYALIRDAWPYGNVHISPLRKSKNYIRLAEYLSKETGSLLGTDYAICGGRWKCSHGLQRVKKLPIKRKKVRDIFDLADFPAEVEGQLIDPDSIVWHFSPDHTKSYCTAHYYNPNPTYPAPRHVKKQRKAPPKKITPHKRKQPPGALLCCADLFCCGIMPDYASD